MHCRIPNAYILYDDSIRIETCYPNTIINIIKVCCVWLTHHCLFYIRVKHFGMANCKKKKKRALQSLTDHQLILFPRHVQPCCERRVLSFGRFPGIWNLRTDVSEETACSKTSAHKIQMPGNHPQERIQCSNLLSEKSVIPETFPDCPFIY